jgi:hypothetical protein
MNHPRSSCVNLDTSDLITIPLPSSTPQSQNVSLEQGMDDVEMGSVDDDDDDNFSTQGGADIQMATDNSDSFSDVTGSMHREEFADVAPAWEAGETFMGKFDLDDFADQRKENLYYPFASKEDWELAAFLLRSGMSMALIDDFLKLQIVSLFALVSKYTIYFD